MRLVLPEFCLVLLVGPSGSGKSTFARRHFGRHEVLSSDAFRAMVSDDENDQEATPAAFELLHLALAKRLERRKLTVVDATNLHDRARQPLLQLARKHHARVQGLVFDLPEEVLVANDAARPGRKVGVDVIRAQLADLRDALPKFSREFREVTLLRTPAAVLRTVVARRPMRSNKRAEAGPFDVIGDVHGCFDELRALVEALGYAVSRDGHWRVTHPEGRRLVFLGDLVDRGPGIAEVLEFVMDSVEHGAALCVVGNHEAKLERYLGGHGKVTPGFAKTVEALSARDDAFRHRVAVFVGRLSAHYELDGGQLVVAHAGLPEAMHGRETGAVKSFALFGETTGETDAHGLPIRLDWAQKYGGKAAVVYGHTPVDEPAWVNGTACVDTGCVYGGKLTAMRWPERTFVSVPARQAYWEQAPASPPVAPG